MSEIRIIEKFPLTVRVLHWSTAALLIGLLAIGLYMQDMPLKDPGKFTLYPWHRAFGVLAFALLIARLTVRLGSTVPEIPKSIPWHERTGAKLVDRI